jgi:hypothetical protein
MSIWRPAPVDQEPEIVLDNWMIVEAEFQEGPPSRHFVGYHGSGRVSSSIVEFDPQTQRGKTRSGRIYQLTGKPSSHSDALYVWSWWAVANGVTSWKDVSGQVLEESIPKTEDKNEPTL